jgi:hypothetical protein
MRELSHALAATFDELIEKSHGEAPLSAGPPLGPGPAHSLSRCVTRQHR